MQISATVHLQKNVQYEKIPVLLSTVQPIRAGKNSSVHRSIQRMGNRFSKTLQVKIAYYMQNLGTFFYFTLNKFFLPLLSIGH